MRSNRPFYLPSMEDTKRTSLHKHRCNNLLGARIMGDANLVTNYLWIWKDVDKMKLLQSMSSEMSKISDVIINAYEKFHKEQLLALKKFRMLEK